MPFRVLEIGEKLFDGIDFIRVVGKHILGNIIVLKPKGQHLRFNDKNEKKLLLLLTKNHRDATFLHLVSFNKNIRMS